MGSEKLKLVYIASSGRSGSTVLELLLGAHSRCWTLGEFHVLPWLLRTNVKPCGCGSAVAQCAFWRPVAEDCSAELLDGSIARFRASCWADHTLRFRELPFLASSSPRHRTRRQSDLAQYAKDNSVVLCRVLRQARNTKGDQVCWLVDSSKSPYRLLWLKETGLFDVRVIHLVKDPRAFVHSTCKNQQGISRPWKLGKAALRWNVENHLFDRLFRSHFSARDVFRLRYDDLATNPQLVLGQICQWLELPPDDDLSAKFRTENHGIAGNPSRFDSAGIRLDEKWRVELGHATQLLVRAATTRLTWRYGFPW